MKLADLAPSRRDWIITRSRDLGFECRRCGAEQPMKPPVSLNYWQSIAAAFVKEHSDCERTERVMLHAEPQP